jgi:hypothetical protein
MTTSIRWTSADLEALPDDGKRYEIIDGELFMSKQPNWHHLFACGRLFRFLDEWNDRTGLGVVNAAPALFSPRTTMSHPMSSGSAKLV